MQVFHTKQFSGKSKIIVLSNLYSRKDVTQSHIISPFIEKNHQEISKTACLLNEYRKQLKQKATLKRVAFCLS